MKNSFQVFIIEDDPMVQEVNREFVESIPGFTVIGTARNGTEGTKKVKELHPDLLILDIYMPEKDGLETLHSLRKEKISVDIIVITAANDPDTIREMLQNGAIDYIIKPFKFDRLKQALNNYRRFRSRFNDKSAMSQRELDRLLGSSEKKEENTDLPKGLNQVTLEQIVEFLYHQDEPRSAEEVAEGIGIARVTARRYLDYLERTGKVKINIQYGGVGRPSNRYQLYKKLK